jgi:hypothetical protein
MQAIHGAGWPDVFAFVYDEFWLATRLPALSQVLTAALGARYQQLPDIWGHYVSPGTRGWKPHLDGNAGDRFTVWIALSDATLENSCMYLIPADKAPGEPGSFHDTPEFAKRDVRTMLQHVRALPIAAGGALSWSHQTIHWGSGSVASVPRLSFSQEFIAESGERGPDDLPVLDGQGEIPSFRERLYRSAAAIVAYQHHEPLVMRFAEVSRRLVELTA